MLAAFLCIGCSGSNQTVAINLNDYLTIEADGYDGYGTAKAVFDTARLDEDFGGKIVATEKKVKKAAGESEYVAKMVQTYNGAEQYTIRLNENTPSDIAKDCFEWDVDRMDGLSNGDTVTCSLKTDENASLFESMYGITFTAEDFTITIDDLEEVAEFNAFDIVDVKYEGAAPIGEAKLSIKDNIGIYQDLVYSISPESGLSNGDKVTVTVKPNPDYYTEEDRWEKIVDKYGKIPKETSRQYTVSGLDTYITSVSQIPDELIRDMQEQAETVFATTIEAGLDEATQELLQGNYIGNYLVSSKDKVSGNRLYLVYKIRINNYYAYSDRDRQEDFDKNTDFYWYCMFENIAISADGECKISVGHYESPTDSYFDIDSGIPSNAKTKKVWRYYGFETLDSMLEKITGGKADSLNIEENITDIDFDDADDEEYPVTNIQSDTEQDAEATEATE